MLLTPAISKIPKKTELGKYGILNKIPYFITEKCPKILDFVTKSDLKAIYIRLIQIV
jgi:hypothetical protein